MKLKDKLIVIIFISIIFLSFIINTIKKDNLVSFSERRKLALKPAINSNSLFSGEYTKGIDDYTTDQFYGRESFRYIKSKFELNILGKKDYNNIFYENGYLIEQIYNYDINSVLNITNKINRVIDKYSSGNVYYSIVPDKNYYSKSNLKLPYDTLTFDFNNNINSGIYIDLFNSLDLGDYYYSDSHWKQESLYDVVNSLNNQINFTEHIDFDYSKKNLGYFKGVYNGKVPCYEVLDEFKILTNNVIDNASVSYLDDPYYRKVYYGTNNLKDLYDVYLGGSKSLIDIKNTTSFNNKKLIIFRDSFGSSLAPLLVNYYDEIILVDLRYINLDVLSNYINFDNSDILFIYSVSIINDSSSIK